MSGICDSLNLPIVWAGGSKIFSHPDTCMTFICGTHSRGNTLLFEKDPQIISQGHKALQSFVAALSINGKSVMAGYWEFQNR